MRKAKLHIVRTGPAINLDAVYAEPTWPGSADESVQATIDPVKAGRFRRQRNYHLMRRARFMLQNVTALNGNHFRVCDCRRHVANGEGGKPSEHVQVWRDEGSKIASFRKLAVCGSVWTCAVCAAKIAQVRRGEVQDAAANAQAAGYGFAMVTMTIRHARGDALRDLVEKMTHALKLCRNNRGPSSFRKAHEFAGLIRALEVTYGDANGWHPHLHELHFFKGGLSEDAAAEYRASIARAWLRACETVGLAVPDFDIAVDVKAVPLGDDTEAARVLALYVAKGFAAELVYGMRKSARAGRYSVWDLCELGRQDLFSEYARAFYGRRQLLWSPGLKKLLGVADLSDDDAAGDAVEVEGERAQELLVSIPQADWPKLLRVPGDGRAFLLDLLEGDGLEDHDRAAGITPYHRAQGFLASIGVRALWGESRLPWDRWWKAGHFADSGLHAA